RLVTGRINFFLQRPGLIAYRSDLLSQIVMELLSERMRLFFCNKDQGLLQPLPFKPYFQVTGNRIDKLLLFLDQNWFVDRIKYAQLPADPAVHADQRTTRTGRFTLDTPGPTDFPANIFF